MYSEPSTLYFSSIKVKLMLIQSVLEMKLRTSSYLNALFTGISAKLETLRKNREFLSFKSLTTILIENCGFYIEIICPKRDSDK